MASNKKTGSFGTCSYGWTSPQRSKLTNGTVILNVGVSFDEALKLYRALDEALSAINKYKRSTAAGKRAGVNLAIHLDQDRISIHEARI